LRYAKLCRLFETPDEQRIAVERMVACVKQIDPFFEKELSDPIPLESTLEYQVHQAFAGRDRACAAAFTKDFDARLEGKVSRLISYSSQAEATLAQSMRFALGRTAAELPDERALQLLLDPKENRILGDTLGTVTLDRLSQLLHHVHFAFQKKLSHTADSQDQRHRTVPSSRPFLGFHYGGQPDYITPFGVTQSEPAHELFRQTMDTTFSAINRLLDSGVKEEYAFYLLPNAYPIRMVSSGDLHSWQHKWKLRSCYNAQEEIFRATIDEVSQVNAVLPQIGQHLRAPCYVRLRAGSRPYCPEGDKFCGLPVWKYEIGQYARKSL
jgi:thymidylate synthase ThyX